MEEHKSHSAKDNCAIAYHSTPKPGKIEVVATKPLNNRQDLIKAYSPGVAEASLAIQSNPRAAETLTSRSNLVAVVTNGTAVLGLGDIGPLAAKPVMEGKSVLFKQFAGIDCFDLEIDEQDPVKLAEIIISLEPTFAAVNLEDIKAPECFEVERICRERMNIPVFHDDQHGTAIVVGAALKNAAKITGRALSELKVVATGGGAAGIACLEMLLKIGVRPEHIYLFDEYGFICDDRSHAITQKQKKFCRSLQSMELEDAFCGADMFLGLSAPGVVTRAMITAMADEPIVFALANPEPEILPEIVMDARPDAIIATGRSDYPNQVNNALCFPYIFRGALNCGATSINDAMQLACLDALSNLAQPSSDCPENQASHDKYQLVPDLFDDRLEPVISQAVALAATSSGVLRSK